MAARREMDVELGPIHRSQLKDNMAGNTSPGRSSLLATDPPAVPYDTTSTPRTEEEEPSMPSRAKSIAIIATITATYVCNTFSSGALTVAILEIAKDLDLPSHQLLMPASVYALGLTCTLLLLGALADTCGTRPMFLTGSALYTAMTLGIALSTTPIQLIIFRAFSAVSMAAMMPCAVSIITTNFPCGRARNTAFSFIGGANPIGFALGLFLGGVLVKVSSWRTAYYLIAGIGGAQFILAFFTLPKPAPQTLSRLGQRLKKDFDWCGVVLASSCLGLLSYLLSEIARGSSMGGPNAASTTMRQPQVIVCLIGACILGPCFVLCESRQERLARPVVLPNSLWYRIEFASVCGAVFLVWSFFNSYGYLVSLTFQELQHLDALQSALRFIPLIIVGVLTNMAAPRLMEVVPAGPLAGTASLVSAVAPLLFALLDPAWSYWPAEFPAMIICVISSDILFNLGNLVYTTILPEDKQALAGSVFSTVSQLGNSLGVALAAIVATSVTSAQMGNVLDTHTEEATLAGYRAAFWFCFGLAVTSALVGCLGLWKAGKVGLAKKEEESN